MGLDIDTQLVVHVLLQNSREKFDTPTPHNHVWVVWWMPSYSPRAPFWGCELTPWLLWDWLLTAHSCPFSRDLLLAEERCVAREITHPPTSEAPEIFSHQHFSTQIMIFIHVVSCNSRIDHSFSVLYIIFL